MRFANTSEREAAQFFAELGFTAEKSPTQAKRTPDPIVRGYGDEYLVEVKSKEPPRTRFEDLDRLRHASGEISATSK